MKLFSLITVLFFSVAISAQTRLTREQLDALPNTIENQFIKVYKKSNNWQDYKTIKKRDFLSLQKKVLDSVAIIKKDVFKKQETINKQEATINSLNERIGKLDGDLSTSLENQDSISLFGLQLNKVTYNTILWSIIAGLLIGLLFFIFRFKKSNALTKEATKNLNETEEEFEEYRKRTLEKEQKLRRQLHDEINKNR